MCRNILDHRDALWRFAHDSNAEPPTITPSANSVVCWRRCSGGSQRERGNQFAANLTSVIHICRKQHRDVLTYLNSAIQAAIHDRKTPSLIAARQCAP